MGCPRGLRNSTLHPHRDWRPRRQVGGGRLPANNKMTTVRAEYIKRISISSEAEFVIGQTDTLGAYRALVVEPQRAVRAEHDLEVSVVVA